jgi:CSLREA domain-containing protein
MNRQIGWNLATAIAVALAGAASAATITVNSGGDAAADDGACTLREAIAAASTNLASGASGGECGAGDALPIVDTIAFAIPGAGVHTIQPTTLLPAITEAVVIDGYTEPGASANTLAIGDNAVLAIELDASGITDISDLLRIQGPGSTIRGLVVNRVRGVSISLGSDDNVIEGNFLNVDPSGTVLLQSGAFTVMRTTGSNNVIGGTDPAARNVIGAGGGANAGTLMIGGNGNLVQGNYVGTDRTGTLALQSDSGVNGIELGTGGLASNTVIGGDTPGAGNVIVATTSVIRLSSGVTATTIQGNHIGVDASGSAVLGGFVGINTDNAPAGIQIGGVTPGAGNIIAGMSVAISLGDGASGVVIQGNHIGTDASGTLPLHNFGDAIFVNTAGVDSLIGGTEPGAGNTIANTCGMAVRVLSGHHWPVLGNSIHSNRGLGISLNNGTPAENDAGDGDTGANDLQNYPVITSAVTAGGSATLSGTLNSTPSTSFRLEFFASEICDATGYGEGQQFIGTTNVTTDSNGDAAFGPLIFAAPDNAEITATATDPDGNTSEFSQCVGPHDHMFADGFEVAACS